MLVLKWRKKLLEKYWKDCTRDKLLKYKIDSDRKNYYYYVILLENYWKDCTREKLLKWKERQTDRKTEPESAIRKPTTTITSWHWCRRTVASTTSVFISGRRRREVPHVRAQAILKCLRSIETHFREEMVGLLRFMFQADALACTGLTHPTFRILHLCRLASHRWYAAFWARAGSNT